MALAAAALAAASCARGVDAERTLRQYVAAVQLEDVNTLFCLSAGAAGGEGGADPAARREAFRGWLAGELEAYRAGRDAGFVELEGSAVRLAKVFTLGKGTFWTVERIAHPEPGRIDVDLAIRFAYDQIDVSHLSEGTGFYVAGSPPGRVHHIVIPAVPRSFDATVLDTAVVRFRLARQAEADGCAERWAVIEAEPLPGTLTTLDLVWNF